MLTAETSVEASRMETLLEGLQTRHSSSLLEFFIRTEPRPQNGVADLVAKGYIAPLHRQIISEEIGEWVAQQELEATAN